MKLINTLLFAAFTSFSLFAQLNIKDAAPMSDVKMKNVDGAEISLKEAQGKNGLIVIFSCYNGVNSYDEHLSRSLFVKSMCTKQWSLSEHFEYIYMHVRSW
jgi:hypothetical protein